MAVYVQGAAFDARLHLTYYAQLSGSQPATEAAGTLYIARRNLNGK
jgi:hypothetical protein